MKKNKGFSLVELMIALVIGLFLLSGLYSLFSGNQKSISLTRSNGEIISEGSRTLNIIKMYIQYAGYRDYTQIVAQNYLPTDNANLWSEGQFIRGGNDDNTEADIKNTTDDITIRYWGSSNTVNITNPVASGVSDNSVIDCSGAGIPNNTVLTLHLYIDTHNNLTCHDSNNHTVIVASGVDNMQIRYLVKSGSSMIYRTAPLTVAESTSVSRVEVGLLMGVDYDQSLVAAQSNYTLLGVSSAVAADHKLRQVYTDAILIRNR